MRERRLAVLVATLLSMAPLQAETPRPDVGGLEAALTADHPLAVAAGADVLRRGGNAVDAAVTMAGVLSVVRPHMNGVGGDAFLLIRDARTGRVHALNGSGAAGGKATPALFREHGPLSVTVPGAVAAWADALQRFGTIPLAKALGPAIRYAREGFPVSRRLSLDIAAERERVAADPPLAALYLENGTPSAPGALLRQPDLARTLEAIAAGGPDALYRGELGRRIGAYLEAEGGTVAAADLAKHRSEWTEPIATTYRGLRVLAMPPNSQGVTLLEMLNLLETAHWDRDAHDSPAYAGFLVIVKELAYADRDRYVADPRFAEMPVARLISKEHARDLLLGQARPSASTPPRGARGDTVYLSVVDKDGNAVSMIQSLFDSFGSGRMVPGTGVVLHNRGALFNLDPAHVNVIAPGKRPFHTLCPAMALRPDGSLAAVFGSPGGDGQPQTLVQVLNNVLLFGMTPQQAVDAPRLRALAGRRVAFEGGYAAGADEGLRQVGYQRVTLDAPAEFGGAQMILRTPAGALLAGADHRREAYAIAW